jgi:hypothetical protein
MGMEATAYAWLGSVDPVDATDRERQRSARFGHREAAASVAALRDVDELDELIRHQRA